MQLSKPKAVHQKKSIVIFNYKIYLKYGEQQYRCEPTDFLKI